eukprot:Hpha_TRINITY_DN7775_c0_g1::TRINITY_DN7775_c0_g1_i2::g.85336::m.85336/K06883/K06883; uncharacterized protein
MSRHAVLVLGPAGSGKSTFCKVIQDYGDNVGRLVHVMNLDPACEEFYYRPSADVRELTTVDEVAEENALGPNGGLVYAMEHLLENPEWFEETLGDFSEDYLLVDLPGQMELFTHIGVLPGIARLLEAKGYKVAIAYLMDSSVVLSDTAKYIAGTLAAVSAMLTIEMPQVNILTKMDLTRRVEGSEEALSDLLDCDLDKILVDPSRRNQVPGRLLGLSAALAEMLVEFPVSGYRALDITRVESIANCLLEIDRLVEYEEDDDIIEKRRQAVDTANERYFESNADE